MRRSYDLTDLLRVIAMHDVFTYPVVTVVSLRNSVTKVLAIWIYSITGDIFMDGW